MNPTPCTLGRGSMRLRVCMAVAAVCAIAMLLGAASSGAGTSPLIATGLRWDPGRPGLLRIVVGFSGPALRSNQIMAQVRHPASDPTTLASAKLAITAPGAHVETATDSDTLAATFAGTRIGVVKSAGGLVVSLDPPDRRYKYMYYEVPDPRHILILLFESRTPGAAAYYVSGFPHGCIVFSHTRRSTGRITTFGTEHGIFEHQFTLALRGSDGRQFRRTTVHSVGRQWTATLTYAVHRQQWGTLEAVAFSPKDEAISCIAQVAVKLVK
ncbi:MAG: hypothetical protein ACXVVQ_17105 [Solirubrobacteraceae bacterium]